LLFDAKFAKIHHRKNLSTPLTKRRKQNETKPLHPYRIIGNAYDYVDNHIYWDHPRPLDGKILGAKQFCNYSVLQGSLQTPRLIMPCRIYGKPYMVTEFDFCYPNQFRSEGAPIFSAYAALQGWNGIFRFCYSGGKRRALDEVSIESFDTANDTIRMLSERLGIAFFLREDVAEARECFVAGVPENDHSSFWNDYPMILQELGFYGKVGSVSVKNGIASPLLPENMKAFFALSNNARIKSVSCKEFIGYEGGIEKYARSGLPTGKQGKKFISSTGELVADLAQRTFCAVTPRSEAVVVPKGRTIGSKVLTVKANDTFCTAGAIAVDHKVLSESGRILLLHLTDVCMENLTFSSGDKRIVTHWTKGQLLARRGTADFTLTLSPGKWKLYALQSTGKRLKEISFAYKDGKINFKAQTGIFKNEAVFAYELIRQ
jgi:hypothetical protein